MSLLAIIDYGLVVIFFIGITIPLLLSTRSGSQQATASANVPSQRESLPAYLLLAGLFLLLIILTALAQRREAQNSAFG